MQTIDRLGGVYIFGWLGVGTCYEGRLEEEARSIAGGCINCLIRICVVHYPFL
jgi:hypothetical protein